MKQGKKEHMVHRERLAAVLRTLLLVLLSLVLGVKLYAWNAMSLVGNSLPMPFGYGASVVLSGSMSPTLAVNDLVILKETQDVNLGDIIVYDSGGSLIIHRVIDLNGETVTTQGDANNVADEPFDISQVRGKMIGAIPKLGALVLALKTPAGTVALLAAAIILIELSYRHESREDEEIKAIKAEIRKLKEEREKEQSRESIDGN